MYWGDDWPWRGWRTAPHTASKLVAGQAITEPFTVAEAKLHCRVVIDDENALISRYIKAARVKVEQDTGRALPSQIRDLFIDASPDGWSWVRVPYPPLQSVTTVNATDAAGAETIWPSTNYIVDSASVPGRIALTDTGTWPTNVRIFQPIRIRYVAGWATPEDIPADLREAVALWIAWYYENRQPNVIEREVYEALINPYSVFEAA